MKKRKRQIIQAARTLFIKNGFANTSILDIISAANISKGTFYNYFSSKNECLIAIIEEAREEVITRRYEIALNEDPSNIDVLVKQIAILLRINRKNHLIQIFESYSQDADREIKNLFERYLLLETEWLANRLADIYGEYIYDSAYDCAVLALGMIQQSCKMLFLSTKKLANPDEVIHTIFSHIDAIIPSIKQTKKIMTPEVIHSLRLQLEIKTISKSSLIIQLEGFIEKLSNNDPENGVELASYLLKELQSSEEKIYVLQSILFSFNKAFEKTPHEAEVHEISLSLWEYLNKKKSKQ